MCFGQFLCPSSGVIHCTLSNGIFHTGLYTAFEQQDQDGTPWSSILILLEGAHTGMFGGPEVSYHQTSSARDWLSILRTTYPTQNLQRKHRTDNTGRSSCNSGDGKDQRVQSLMLMMMMKLCHLLLIYSSLLPCFCLQYNNATLQERTNSEMLKFPSQKAIVMQHA
jgi:hypothetical protein